MAEEYDNTNSGALFKNERKSTKNHPDRTGSLCVECPDCGAKNDYWMSGWVKQARSTGKPFMSVAITIKDAPEGDQAADDFDEDVPF
jgi:hypothetical protein